MYNGSGSSGRDSQQASMSTSYEYGAYASGRAPASNPSTTYSSYASAPTPGATVPPAPYGAPTPAPYGAPTPAPYGAPTPAPYGAPTPGPYGAPTPSAYPSAPTPGAVYSAPTPYGGAPTPGYGAVATPGNYSGEPTPGYGASVATPGNYGNSAQTPGGYAGAATAAAQPLEYAPRTQLSFSLPGDWAAPGVKVHFARSSFQNGRFDEQNGVILNTSGGLSDVAVDGMERADNVPTATLQPVVPSKAGDSVLGKSSFFSFRFYNNDTDRDFALSVLGGEHRGARATAQSRDGNEWMIKLPSGGE